MARSELALRRATRAYERSFVVAALRGVGLALVLTVAAIALHRTTDATLLVAGALAATLATVGWRGGALARGAFTGVLAGIPVFIAPALYAVFTQGNAHCAQCVSERPLSCVLVCVGTSAVAGILVGRVALRDRAPRMFAASAIASAALTGLLGCSSLGLGGGLGVVMGVLAGSVTGWITAQRHARA